ncbi:hypothetical protein P872_00490 [Rhodonellum psychrophilum GCM71 = DSM 17998]|uniref:Transporter n=2 Tax=Rhodonellum TaxID=336827 RepID=U5C1S3_9BACT|nr:MULTISPECIES: AEC family transporter [Rhodonellum]ERM84018.1 hypothetical protein P872_00490 [Rhodonellum psychrophilum GCM71 = DSM 17998]MDO9551567.1 AEC family transporter [Rhodonellum sp.]SDY39619.1 hypothetical protein SAMN05444412_10120 [Rhodonellum ikkaensis]
MNAILLIIVFLLVGVILQKVKSLPPQTPKFLNYYLIYIVLPAMALRYLPGIEMKLELLLPILSAWIGFGLSWLLFGWLGKKFNWGKSVTGCLVITAGLSNTSFVGFPIVNALYGEEGIKIALLIDQAGSFILVSSVAIVVASIYGTEKKRKRDITRKILTFPPFLFFLIAMFMNLYQWQVGGFLAQVLEIIAMTLTPVALIAVGLQIRINPEAMRSKFLWYGLGYKLILIPAIVLLLFKGVFNLGGLLLKISVIEAAMAPMITATIIAISHDLEPRLASLMVGVGIPLSFLTVGIWYLILG